MDNKIMVTVGNGKKIHIGLLYEKRTLCGFAPVYTLPFSWELSEITCKKCLLELAKK